MARTIALAFGVIYLLVGILGFVLPSPLLGIFAVDTTHNIVHLLLGILGIGAAYGGMSRLYCQVVGVVLLLLGVLGFIIPGAITSIMALNTADNLLHLVSGAVLAYGGFMGSTEVMTRTTTTRA